MKQMCYGQQLVEVTALYNSGDMADIHWKKKITCHKLKMFKNKTKKTANKMHLILLQ